MIKLLNISHFFVLANFEQREILSQSEVLLISGNKTYYSLQDYYLTIEKKEVNGKVVETRSVSDHLPRQLLESIKLKEILLNDTSMRPKEIQVTRQSILALLALISSKEGMIHKGVWLSPYYQLNRSKVKPNLKRYNQN